jgi:small subunit ribosomal protein S9
MAGWSATGRRKTSVARVTLIEGTGKWLLNGRDAKLYFPVEAVRTYVEQPLKLTHAISKYDITARLSGGGINGQAGALRHAIARALVAADPTQREVLKNSGCLTRDARMKEREKYGQPGPRKRFQFSKR